MKLKKTLGLLSTGIVVFVGTTVFAENVSTNDIANITDSILQTDGGTSIGLTQPRELNPSQVKAQYNLLKQFLSPVGWGVAYDVGKNIIFFTNANDVRTAIGDSSADWFTMLRGGENNKTAYDIFNSVGLKPWSILAAIALLALIMYMLVNTKVGEDLRNNVNTRTTRQPTDPMSPNPMPQHQTTSADKNGDGIITLMELGQKLNELRKMGQTDPAIAKVANTVLMYSVFTLFLGIAAATWTIDYALVQAQNWRPLGYIPLSLILLIIYLTALTWFVKIAFSKIAKFATNSEDQITEKDLVNHLLLWGVGGAFILLVGGGLIGIVVKLLTSV